MSKNDPAFPSFEEHWIFSDNKQDYIAHMYPVGGVSKLEYFAAMALTGLLSDPDRSGSFNTYVSYAFDIAVTMVAEAEKRLK